MPRGRRTVAAISCVTERKRKGMRELATSGIPASSDAFGARTGHSEFVRRTLVHWNRDEAVVLAARDPIDLAALTLDQVHGASLSIDQEIATDIGSVRDLVSRILAQWAEAGLVELRRGAVEIIDRGSLASAGRR